MRGAKIWRMLAVALALVVGVTATLVLTDAVALAAPEDGEVLNPDDFNIFGGTNRDLLNSDFGRMLARLLLRIMVIGFDVSLVLGVAVLFWKLVLVLVGKAGRDTVMGRLTDMALAILGIVVILTGGLAMMINFLMRGAQEIQEELSMAPPAVVAQVDGATGAESYGV